MVFAKISIRNIQVFQIESQRNSNILNTPKGKQILYIRYGMFERPFHEDNEKFFEIGAHPSTI